MAQAYRAALEEHADFAALTQAVRARDTVRIKQIWDPLVEKWDERTFYDFVTSSRAFRSLSFRHREIFGQVGFGTGGWDSDFPNSMLEILRVNLLELDDHQRYIVGGVESVLHRLWNEIVPCVHWPDGTSLSTLNGGGTLGRAVRIARNVQGGLTVTDQWGVARDYAAVLVTCQSHLLTTSVEVDEALFEQKLWMARTGLARAATQPRSPCGIR